MKQLTQITIIFLISVMCFGCAGNFKEIAPEQTIPIFQEVFSDALDLFLFNSKSIPNCEEIAKAKKILDEFIPKFEESHGEVTYQQIYALVSSLVDKNVKNAEYKFLVVDGVDLCLSFFSSSFTGNDMSIKLKEKDYLFTLSALKTLQRCFNNLNEQCEKQK